MNNDAGVVTTVIPKTHTGIGYTVIHAKIIVPYHTNQNNKKKTVVTKVR